MGLFVSFLLVGVVHCRVDVDAPHGHCVLLFRVYDAILWS